MLTEIEYRTVWVHTATQKKCCVVGTRKANEIDKIFFIQGWNPLPCKEFKGTYSVLAKWLTENGWVREVSEGMYNPNIVRYIHR